MTPGQMIAFFHQQAARSAQGLELAHASSNLQLAAFNVRQGFKASLMAGLIEWRTGAASPSPSLVQAVVTVRGELPALAALGGGAVSAGDLPIARALIVAFLIGESLQVPDTGDLRADRHLDALLAKALRDEWDELAWETALGQLLSLKGSSLAVETYTAYRSLLHSKDGALDDLVRSAERLFERRKSNGFYAGAEQTEGGGPDNAVTVDYRLAAVLKKLAYQGDSIHRWRWDPTATQS